MRQARGGLSQQRLELRDLLLSDYRPPSLQPQSALPPAATPAEAREPFADAPAEAAAPARPTEEPSEAHEEQQSEEDPASEMAARLASQRRASEGHLEELRARQELTRGVLQERRQRLGKRAAAALVGERPADPPAPWRVARDEESGKWYYYSQQTKAVSWEPPEALDCRPEDPPQPWQLAWDAQARGWYYHNEDTDETSWETPAAASGSAEAEGAAQPLDRRRWDGVDVALAEAQLVAMDEWSRSRLMRIKKDDVVRVCDILDVDPGENIKGQLVAELLELAAARSNGEDAQKLAKADAQAEDAQEAEEMANATGERAIWWTSVDASLAEAQVFPMEEWTQPKLMRLKKGQISRICDILGVEQGDLIKGQLVKLILELVATRS